MGALGTESASRRTRETGGGEGGGGDLLAEKGVDWILSTLPMGYRAFILLG